MINNYLDNDDWRYWWVVAVATLLSFVGFVLACVCGCKRHENKSEFPGLAGMVTITNHADSDSFDRPPTSSDISHVVTQDTSGDGGKRASSGANRSLPDIPKDNKNNVGRDGAVECRVMPQDVIYEVTETIGDPSELYATVQDKNVEKKKNSKPERLVVRSNSQETCSIPHDSVHPYARLDTLECNNDEHPYAQVRNVQKMEQNRKNATQFSDSQPSSASIPTNREASSGNPIAPPRTRRSSSHNSLINVDITCDIQAANAISGGVQANQDLPYMTPPILMPLPRPPQSQHNIVPHQHFSGDSQDSKGYTSISVREPLANIIAQTKAAQNNRQGSSRPLIDPHYATVSDDSDEMYAAIDEQDKVYTSGSETYAQIQPMTNESAAMPEQQQQQQPSQQQQSLNQTPLQSSCAPEDSSISAAPQPPSVDSLRHAAHAHSRQASSSSATSSVVNPSSPKPEKRQANSPLPPPPPPPPPAAGAPAEAATIAQSDVYASIEKRGKSEDRSRSSVSSVMSLEDMYAKVMKKKRETEENPIKFEVATASTCDVNRGSWSSHDSVEIHNKMDKTKAEPMHTNLPSFEDLFNVEMDIEFLKIARSYELDPSPELAMTIERKKEDEAGDSNDDRDDVHDDGYEPLANRKSNDPNYEMLRPQRYASALSSPAKNGIKILPIYSQPLKHRHVSNASSEDPGYERVRLRRRVPDLDQDTDSEPNYESMPHDPGEPNYASVCRPGDSDTDPNYESVTHGHSNYESVRYSNPRNSDPPYEMVNSGPVASLDRVKCNASLDPNYEKIHLSRKVEFNNDSGDTDDEQYVQV